LWDVAKLIHKGNLITLNELKPEKREEIIETSIQLKKLGKEHIKSKEKA
jgi:hypothetical protein